MLGQPTLLRVMLFALGAISNGSSKSSQGPLSFRSREAFGPCSSPLLTILSRPRYQELCRHDCSWPSPRLFSFSCYPFLSALRTIPGRHIIRRSIKLPPCWPINCARLIFWLLSLFCPHSFSQSHLTEQTTLFFSVFILLPPPPFFLHIGCTFNVQLGTYSSHSTQVLCPLQKLNTVKMPHHTDWIRLLDEAAAKKAKFAEVAQHVLRRVLSREDIRVAQERVTLATQTQNENTEPVEAEAEVLNPILINGLRTTDGLADIPQNTSSSKLLRL